MFSIDRPTHHNTLILIIRDFLYLINVIYRFVESSSWRLRIEHSGATCQHEWSASAPAVDDKKHQVRTEHVQLFDVRLGPSFILLYASSEL